MKAAVVSVLSLTIFMQAADAQTSLKGREGELTVTIMGGSLTGTSIQLADDLSKVLSDGKSLRVIPMIGKGAISTLEDVATRASVDFGIIQSDVIPYYSENVDEAVASEVRCVTSVYHEEVHILVKSDVKSIADLKGKTVGFGPETSGGHMTSGVIFRQLGISIDAVSLPHDEAYAKLLAGEIAAMTRVGGKPHKFFSAIEDNGVKLLDVPSDQINAPYVPGRFSSDDYPGLVDAPVATVSVPAYLITKSLTSEDHQKAAQDLLVRGFRENIETLRSGDFHDKWDAVDEKAGTPGCQPFGL